MDHLQNLMSLTDIGFWSLKSIRSFVPQLEILNRSSLKEIVSTLCVNLALIEGFLEKIVEVCQVDQHTNELS